SIDLLHDFLRQTLWSEDTHPEADIRAFNAELSGRWNIGNAVCTPLTENSKALDLTGRDIASDTNRRADIDVRATGHQVNQGFRSTLVVNRFCLDASCRRDQFTRKVGRAAEA